MIGDSADINRLETLGQQARTQPPSPGPRQSIAISTNEMDRLRSLQEINRKLELEMNILREALNKQQDEKFNVNIDHYVRIQELQNKV